MGMKWYIINENNKPSIVKMEDNQEEVFLAEKPEILYQGDSLGEVLQNFSEQKNAAIDG